MTKKNDIYKCEICGNIVEVTHAGGGELVCCEVPMILKKPNFEDAATEKHIPVIEKIEKGFKVKVGETLHPMKDEHYIEWIELIADGKVYRQNFKPGQEPVVEFCIEAKNVTAREYCNLHGLWQK